jgi:hypothetical protein
VQSGSSSGPIFNVYGLAWVCFIPVHETQRARRRAWVSGVPRTRTLRRAAARAWIYDALHRLSANRLLLPKPANDYLTIIRNG